MDKDMKLKQWAEQRSKYLDENPEQAEVWGEVIEMTKLFEDEQGFSRRHVCEGLFNAAMSLAYWRDTDTHLQKPEDVRAFYEWAFKWLKMAINIYTTPEEQASYEATYGKDPEWLYRAETFKDDHQDKTLN